MAEIAGLAIGVASLAIGVASLAGLFTTCTAFFDKIDRAKGFGGSYQHKTTQFRICKHLFQEWGKQAGLARLQAGGDTDVADRLKDVDRRNPVYDILASIEQLFVDTERLEKKLRCHSASSRSPHR